jgi:hypothetical protein
LENLSRLKRDLPKVLKAIPLLSEKLIGHPPFIISRTETLVTVIRKDYGRRLDGLATDPVCLFANRLTFSEWTFLTKCGGLNPGGLPITMHDVLEDNGIITKIGNPYRNDSWREFHLALTRLAKGIPDPKSPVGFSFRLNDPYGVKRAGRIFYEHREGPNIIEALQNKFGGPIDVAAWLGE